MFLSLDIVDNYFPCTMKQFLRVSTKYRQSYCIFGEIFPKKMQNLRTGFSLYKIATKKITKYMYLWLDIVDNYFLCTMKQFPRVSMQY